MPLVVETISSIALALTDDVPMPTCEKLLVAKHNAAKKMNILLNIINCINLKNK